MRLDLEQTVFIFPVVKKHISGKAVGVDEILHEMLKCRAVLADMSFNVA